jgi:Family of unknown function (DUF5906)
VVDNTATGDVFPIPLQSQNILLGVCVTDDTIALDKVLEIAKEAGFRMFEKGRYILSSGSVGSFNKMADRLKLSERLEDAGLYKESSLVRRGSKEILGLFESQTKDISYFKQDVDTSGHLTTEEASQSLREQIMVMTSVTLNKKIDPVGHRTGQGCIVLVNIPERSIIRGDQQSIDRILALLGTTRAEVLESPEVPIGVPTFNPYTTDLFFPLSGGSQLKKAKGINTYMPARWRDLKAAPSYGGWVKILIEHLFTEANERELVLDWLHYALVNRNGTVLTLAGDRGTGKSTFASLVGALLGSTHTEYVKDSILDGQFNPQMRDARIIVFEEVPLNTDKGVSKIKAWCNKTIAIEEKGRDPYTTEAFFSIIMLLNKLEDFKISPSERRFSIPSVTDRDLQMSIRGDVIAKINESLEKESGDAYEEVARFGEFLLKRVPKNSSQTPIKGEYFYTVSELSLTQWQSVMIDHLIKNGVIGKPVNFSTIFSEYKKDEIIVPDREDRVANFLRDYRHRGSVKVGTTVPALEGATAAIQFKSKNTKFKRKFSILPNEEFLLKFGDQYKNRAEDEL